MTRVTMPEPCKPDPGPPQRVRLLTGVRVRVDGVLVDGLEGECYTVPGDDARELIAEGRAVPAPDAPATT